MQFQRQDLHKLPFFPNIYFSCLELLLAIFQHNEFFSTYIQDLILTEEKIHKKFFSPGLQFRNHHVALSTAIRHICILHGTNALFPFPQILCSAGETPSPLESYSFKQKMQQILYL